MDSELPEDSFRRSFSPRSSFSSQFESTFMIWDDLDLHSMLMGPVPEHAMLMGPAHELGMFEGRIPKENLTVLIFFSSVILATNQWISIRNQNGRGQVVLSAHEGQRPRLKETKLSQQRTLIAFFKNQ